MIHTLDTLINELKQHEGFCPHLYRCPSGKLTIGYGQNLETTSIPEEAAAIMLKYQIELITGHFEQYPWFDKLSEPRKRVILNMAYNLGTTGLFGFKKMITAIQNSDFDTAANEMVDSKWYEQVGNRARQLVFMMKHNRPERINA